MNKSEVCRKLHEAAEFHLLDPGIWPADQEAVAAFRHSILAKDPGVQAWLYARQGNGAAARRVLEENASSPINPFTAVAH